MLVGHSFKKSLWIYLAKQFETHKKISGFLVNFINVERCQLFLEKTKIKKNRVSVSVWAHRGLVCTVLRCRELVVIYATTAILVDYPISLCQTRLLLPKWPWHTINATSAIRAERRAKTHHHRDEKNRSIILSLSVVSWTFGSLPQRPWLSLI